MNSNKTNTNLTEEQSDINFGINYNYDSEIRIGIEDLYYANKNISEIYKKLEDIENSFVRVTNCCNEINQFINKIIYNKQNVITIKIEIVYPLKTNIDNMKQLLELTDANAAATFASLEQDDLLNSETFGDSEISVGGKSIQEMQQMCFERANYYDSLIDECKEKYKIATENDKELTDKYTRCCYCYNTLMFDYNGLPIDEIEDNDFTKEYYNNYIKLCAELTGKDQQTVKETFESQFISYQEDPEEFIPSKILTDWIYEWTPETEIIASDIILYKCLKETSLMLAYGCYQQYNDYETNKTLYHISNGENRGNIPYLQYDDDSHTFAYMDDNEKEIAIYLYNTGRVEELNNFLEFRKEASNMRHGEELAKEVTDRIENAKPVGVAGILAVEGVGDGINNFFAGIDNLFNADGIISPEQYKAVYILQYINEKYDENTLENILFTADYEISSSIGNMLPPILLSELTCGLLNLAPGVLGLTFTANGLLNTAEIASTVGAISMGLSATGNARENGLQNGMSSFGAWTYGILTGISEAGLEKLIGGIPGISNLDTTFFGKMLAEGGEEALQEILEPLFFSLATGEEYKIDMNAVFKSGIYGMITAGLLNGGNMAINNVFNCDVSTLTEEQRKAILDKFKGMDMTTFDNQTLLINVLVEYGINVSVLDIIELSKIKDPLIIEDGVNNGTITKTQVHQLFNDLVGNSFGSLNLSDDVATSLYINLLEVAKNTGIEISTVQESSSLLHSMIDVTTLFSKLDENNFVFEQLPNGAKEIKIIDDQLKEGVNTLLENVKSQYNLNINLDMICKIVVDMNPSLIENISANKQTLINNFQNFLFIFTSIDMQSLKDASCIEDVAVNLGFNLDDISLINIDGNIDGDKVNVLAGKMNNFNTRVIYKYNEYLITKNIYQMLSEGKSIYEVTKYASTARNSVRVVSQTIMTDYIDPKLKQGTNGWNVNYKTSFLNKLFKSSPNLQMQFVEYMQKFGICTDSQTFVDISYEVKQNLMTDQNLLSVVENFYDTIIDSDGTSIDTNIVSNEVIESTWLQVLQGSVSANDKVDSFLGLDKFQNLNVYDTAKSIYDSMQISDHSIVEDCE